MFLRGLYYLLRMIFLCGFVGFSTSERYIGFGAVMANWLLNEPRAIASIVDDFSITHQISQKIFRDSRFDHANIIPISYDQTVLLIGQAPTLAIRSQALEYAHSVAKTKHVFNQITISSPARPWQRIRDTTLSLMVRIKLISTSKIRHCRFRIYTTNNEIFILGKTDAQEADRAVSVLQHTNGVAQVTRLITITK